ncbi:toxin HipA, partial [bacterium B17]
MADPRRVNVATVRLWSEDVGAVAWNGERGVAEFEYEASFINKGLEVSPLTMPLKSGVFSFPELNRETYRGLPGLLADALPDRFGNRIIDAWLARQGRNQSDFTPVERLCYMGVRAMGALEFKPTLGPQKSRSTPLEVSEIT